MKINEAEELLGISKANIRFYEKQGLLTPNRSENRYRDYSGEDIDRLRQIIILRKLGVSVQDIGKILSGELPLQEAMTANIASLEEQIEQLTGALKLSKQIRTEELTELDTSRYWEIIHREEQQGGQFFEIMSEYWVGTEQWPGVGQMFHKMLLTEPGDGWKKMLRNAALLCLGWVVVRLLAGKPLDLNNLLYYPGLIFYISLFLFPVYLLGRRFPKAREIVMGILFFACLLFVFGILLLIVVTWLNSYLHFWY